MGRDLEQNVAGFAEVDRAEVLAVLLFGRMPAVGADQLLCHLRLLYVARSAEGDVMHRTAPLVPSQNSRGFVDVDHAAFHLARPSAPDHPPSTATLPQPQ